MTRKLNNTPRKESILKLRSEGKTYNQIAQALGCSKSTIAYHCDGGKEKRRVQNSTKKRKKICRKVSAFKSRCARSNYHNLLNSYAYSTVCRRVFLGFKTLGNQRFYSTVTE